MEEKYLLTQLFLPFPLSQYLIFCSLKILKHHPHFSVRTLKAKELKKKPSDISSYDQWWFFIEQSVAQDETGLVQISRGQFSLSHTGSWGVLFFLDAKDCTNVILYITCAICLITAKFCPDSQAGHACGWWSLDFKNKPQSKNVVLPAALCLKGFHLLLPLVHTGLFIFLHFKRKYSNLLSPKDQAAPKQDFYDSQSSAKEKKTWNAFWAGWAWLLVMQLDFFSWSSVFILQRLKKNF